MTKPKKLRTASSMSEKHHVAETANPKPELMKIARELRAKANKMTDADREESLRFGMQLIYGGSSSIPAKAGRP
jgi:hypothetical protein